MEVLILNIHFANPPLVHATDIIEKFLEVNGNFSLQHTLPIFGNPYQMKLKPMFRMRSACVSGHNQIMPDLPSLRQLCWLRFGCHSSPG